MFDDIKDKVVLITGATGAIGNTTAEIFASYGCKMVLTGRKADILKEVHARCEKITKQSSNVVSITCDISDDSSVKKLVSTVIEKFGKLDVLVNMVGYYSIGPVSDQNFVVEFEKNMLLNTIIVRLCHHVLPHLVKSKGAIVNASSIGKPVKSFSNFTFSKAALDMFTKSLALEFGPKGVRVNSVGISVIISKNSIIWQKMKKEEQENYLKTTKDVVLSKTPLRRVGNAEELANVVLFLSSNASSFVTGTLIPVDGGYSLS